MRQVVDISVARYKVEQADSLSREVELQFDGREAAPP